MTEDVEMADAEAEDEVEGALAGMSDIGFH
jgi:hypothetical protein